MNNGKKNRKCVRNIEWYSYTMPLWLNYITFFRLIFVEIWYKFAWFLSNIGQDLEKMANYSQLIISVNNMSQNQNLKSTFENQKEIRIAVDVKSDNFCKTKCPFCGFELNMYSYRDTVYIYKDSKLLMPVVCFAEHV